MSDGVAREHRTVTRVTSILEAAAKAPDGILLSELTSVVGAPKSSIHGLVKGLVATGYLQEHGGAYSLGPAIAMLPAPSRPSIIAQSRRSLEDIQKRTGETTILGTLVGESVVYVDMVEADAPIRYSAPLRVRRPLYPTSSGKCFLANMPAARRDNYLREQIPDPTARGKVIAELDAVRRDSLAYNNGETVPDVEAVAAPIKIGGRVIACISVAGPKNRMDGKLAEVAEILTAEVRRLSRGATP
jgi:DNA-binding IclR family transcriptional regulator